MDLKKLFKNEEGVSEVMGVVMLLAITATLAALTMSSVIDVKPTSPSPEVNIGITENSTATSTVPGSIKLEHISGKPINFGDPKLTKVTASLNGAESVDINATCLNTLSVGDIKILPLTSDGTTNVFGDGPVSGDTVIIKIVDLKSNQIIASNEVKF